MAMNYLEIIGTIIGLLYLWLEYRASIMDSGHHYACHLYLCIL